MPGSEEPADLPVFEFSWGLNGAPAQEMFKSTRKMDARMFEIKSLFIEELIACCKANEVGGLQF